ncbi:hypothetical protein XF35_41820, partial [Streptomyces platensis subsp. clarensis]|nr:hypothetical protein [Streptomyces platensis subsp. clarensis]
PDVTSRTYDVAVQQLQVLGFTNVSRQDVDSDQPMGTVISQSPNGNTDQPKDVQVVLKVSKGPQQQTQPIPLVTGMTLDQARATLAAFGYQRGNVDGPNSGDARVKEQDPQPGAQGKPNQAINVKTEKDGGGGWFG